MKVLSQRFANKFKFILQSVLLFTLFAGLTACATAPQQDLALERLRNSLDELKSDSELGKYAHLSLGDAERALREAEQPGQNKGRHDHLLYMADRRIRIARAQAEQEQLLANFLELDEKQNQMLLKAQTLEATSARREAERTRMMHAAMAEESEYNQQLAAAAEISRQASDKSAKNARAEANAAHNLANAQAIQVELARQEAKLAGQQNETLQRQLANMQLRHTESGVVVTLGDVLFKTGQSQLKTSAMQNLDEVIDLLQSEPDKKIRIEGHTDTVGAALANLKLSEARATSVRDALVEKGVSADRLTTLGLGEDFPIDSNDTEQGRSNNRRVDVILLDQ